MKKCHLFLFAGLVSLLAAAGCRNNAERFPENISSFSSRFSDSSAHSEMSESTPVFTSLTSSDTPNNQEAIQSSEITQTPQIPQSSEPAQSSDIFSGSESTDVPKVSSEPKTSESSPRSELSTSRTVSQSSSALSPQKPSESSPPKQCAHEYILNSDKPSCETGGTVVYICKKCGESYSREIPAGTHDYTETITLKATDYSQGVKTYCCKNCQKTYSEKYSLGHTINLGNGKTAVVYGYWDLKISEEIFRLVNEYRRQNSLCELKPSEKMNETARLRALECAYFYSHTRPNGSRCFTAFPTSYALAGENVGAGFKGNAQKVMNAWINSPLHNDNLLNPEFLYLGTSLFVMTDYDPQMHGGTYFSQEFICF